MKSNAQMHHQKALADAIHTVEGVVTSINEKVASGQVIDLAEVRALKEGNTKVAQLIERGLKRA
jgi:hypothetical protein